MYFLHVSSPEKIKSCRKYTFDVGKSGPYFMCSFQVQFQTNRPIPVTSTLSISVWVSILFGGKIRVAREEQHNLCLWILKKLMTMYRYIYFGKYLKQQI